MLSRTSTIKGYTIAARDGDIGTVSDFLFDDSSWLVRWVVVDTGSWLSGRKVLLPPSVLGHVDTATERFSVRLSKQQVKDSPDISTERSVSRQMESSVYGYYSLYPYWASGFYMGGYGYMGGGLGPLGAPGYGYGGSEGSQRYGEYYADYRRDDDDPHLRSIDSVNGYHIHARDGEVGHVEDFLLEDADWSIHYLVVDTKNWWPGKSVLISPRSVRDINWSSGLVNLEVDRQTVKQSPEYDPSAVIDRDYERSYHAYYGTNRASERVRPG